MCDECGCEEHNTEERKTIQVNRSVNETNDALAHQVKDFIQEQGALCANIMGSPGCGKTTLIEKMSETIEPEEMFIIQGDLESDIDTQRLENKGIKTAQINTHSGCHLNAAMINRVLLEYKISGYKYVLIENVGNLVCPAGINIGQHMDIVMSSTTEGSDKPRKYPHIFRDAHMIIISKMDIADSVGFEEESYVDHLRRINPKSSIIKAGIKEFSEGYQQAAQQIQHHRQHLFGHEHTHKQKH